MDRNLAKMQARCVKIAAVCLQHNFSAAPSCGFCEVAQTLQGLFDVSGRWQSQFLKACSGQLTLNHDDEPSLMKRALSRDFAISRLRD
jgi:hypothetical protein